MEAFILALISVLIAAVGGLGWWLSRLARAVKKMELLRVRVDSVQADLTAMRHEAHTAYRLSGFDARLRQLERRDREPAKEVPHPTAAGTPVQRFDAAWQRFKAAVDVERPNIERLYP